MLYATFCFENMHTWIVTCSSAPAFLHGLPPAQLRDCVEGLAETLLHRIVQPTNLFFYSAMGDSLTHNRQLLCSPLL